MFDDFPMGKALGGSLAFPFMAMIFWSYSPGCSSILLLIAGVFWFVTYQKIATRTRNISRVVRPPRQQHFTTVEPRPTLPPSPPKTSAGSDSIFL